MSSYRRLRSIFVSLLFLQQRYDLLEDIYNDLKEYLYR